MFQKKNLCVKSMIKLAIRTVEQEKVMSCCKDGVNQILSIE